MVEAWLRRVLEGDKAGVPFRLRDASYGKGGLRPEFREGDWDRVRDAIYEDRG